MEDSGIVPERRNRMCGWQEVGGVVRRAVDFDVLKQELADTLIDERELRYQFTWPDKQKSILLANTPTNKTLRPCKEESADFDNTQNLYIIKPDRTVFDLLFQVMLDLGKPLSAKIEEKNIAGKRVFIVNDDDLIACFEDSISAEIVTEIAKAKPLYAVFRDSGLSSDSVAANFEQIFATYSPSTVRKVL
ncbi:MAG: hypothetical protein HDR32_08005 [Treponema sp.]|nr:hypothetical protein [Treponema sp.]